MESGIIPGSWRRPDVADGKIFSVLHLSVYCFALLDSVGFSKLRGRAAEFLVETFAEVGVAIEAHPKCHLIAQAAVFAQEFFGMVQAQGANEARCRLVSERGQLAMELGSAHPELFGHGFDAEILVVEVLLHGSRRAFQKRLVDPALDQTPGLEKAFGAEFFLELSPQPDEVSCQHQQFSGVEGLGEKSIGAGFQSLQSVFLASAGGEQNHGKMAGFLVRFQRGA